MLRIWASELACRAVQMALSGAYRGYRMFLLHQGSLSALRNAMVGMQVMARMTGLAGVFLGNSRRSEWFTSVVVDE